MALGALAASLLIGGGSAVAGPNERASEVGHCSSFYGKLQLRDDIARDIASGDEPPGFFYREAAKNKGDENCN